MNNFIFYSPTEFVFAKDDFKMFIYVCGAAIFVKLMEFFIRFTNR